MTQAVGKPQRRRLICACCGGYAGKWHQWWNQDTGFGICASCVKWMKCRGDTDAKILDYYGKEGRNWGQTYANHTDS